VGPDPPPSRDAGHELLLRAFLSDWGPPPAENAGDARPPDFAAQCEALLSAKPPIVSSVMGLFPSEFVARLRRAGVAWFASVSTVAEAQAAEAAGADVIVAQGTQRDLRVLKQRRNAASVANCAALARPSKSVRAAPGAKRANDSE